jgi:hypothetical protein
VGAEDDPAVIERQEEQNQARYLFQEDHTKLLEQFTSAWRAYLLACGGFGRYLVRRSRHHAASGVVN